MTLTSKQSSLATHVRPRHFFRPHFSPISFCVLLAFIFFLAVIPFIGVPEVAGSSEAREIHVARVVAEQNEWIAPLRNGIVPSKPPLFHWLVASVAAIFDVAVSPFWTRLVSLFAAALLLGFTVRLTLALLARAPMQLHEHRFIWAFISAAILSVTPGFVQLSVDARVDMLYCALVALSWSSVAIPLLENTQTVRRDWMRFWGFAALAVLTKGPLGLVLPAVLIFALLVLVTGPRIAVRECFLPRAGWFLFVLIVAAWYLPAYQQMGWPFIEKQFFFENVQRFGGGEHINTEPWWFYLPSFLGSAAPWSLIFLWLSIASVKGKHPEQESYAAFRKHSLIPVVLFWLGFFLFSLSSGKRHAYLVPLFPFVAAAVSIYLAQLKLQLSDAALLRLRQFVTRVPEILFVCIVLCAFLLEAAPIWAQISVEASHAAAWVQTIKRGLLFPLAFALVLLLYKANVQSEPLKLGMVWLAAIICINAALGVGLGLKAEFKGFHSAAAEASAYIPQNSKLIVIRTLRDEFFDPFMLYFGRETSIQEASTLTAEKGDFILYKRAHLPELLARVGALGLIIERQLDFNLPSDIIKGRIDRAYEVALLTSAASGPFQPSTGKL